MYQLAACEVAYHVRVFFFKVHSNTPKYAPIFLNIYINEIIFFLL
jgi:hypothetical protein